MTILCYNTLPMVNPTTYLRQVGREMQKVSWPDKSQTIEMTILVIGVTIIIGAYIGALDYFFQELMSFVVTNL